MKKIFFGLVMVITMIISIPISEAATAHPSGTNLLGSDGTVYFLRGVNGLAPDLATQRVPYTSAGAFLSYKFNSWSKVVPANSADLALPVAAFISPAGIPEFIPPREGSLINDNGTVYLITNGNRAGFVSKEIFLDLGYSFSNVYPGDTSFMVTVAPIDNVQRYHPVGTLINEDGTLYVTATGGERTSETHLGDKIGFPNMEVFNSWGYWLTDVVPANSYDRQLQATANAFIRGENYLNIPPLNFPPFTQ